MSRAIAAIVLSVLVVATACGSSDKTDSSGSASGGSGGAFPVTVKSALGSATIDKNPKRVVAIGWGSQDAALALGVVPVGMEDLSADSEPGQKLLPWEEQRIKDLKGATPTLVTTASGQVPFEKIAALHPDVILAVYSGITGAQFAKLSDIAPTVGYPDKPWETSWQDQIALVGRALGLTPKATVLAAETNKLISNAAKEHPEFRGKTITFGSGTTAESYNFYYDDDPRLQLLKALGFTLAPSVQAGRRWQLEFFRETDQRRESGQRQDGRAGVLVSQQRYRERVGAQQTLPVDSRGQARWLHSADGSAARLCDQRGQRTEPAVDAAHLPTAAEQGRNQRLVAQHVLIREMVM